MPSRPPFGLWLQRVPKVSRTAARRSQREAPARMPVWRGVLDRESRNVPATTYDPSGRPIASPGGETGLPRAYFRVQLRGGLAGADGKPDMVTAISIWWRSAEASSARRRQ